MNTGNVKAQDIQFTDFQKSVLHRFVDRNGKRLYNLEAMTESTFEHQRNGEEKEVKVHMRFLNK